MIERIKKRKIDYRISWTPEKVTIDVWISGHGTEKQEDYLENDVGEEVEQNEAEQAIRSVNTLTKWCEANNNTNEMSDLLDFYAEMFSKAIARLTSYFKPMESISSISKK